MLWLAVEDGCLREGTGKGPCLREEKKELKENLVDGKSLLVSKTQKLWFFSLF